MSAAEVIRIQSMRPLNLNPSFSGFNYFRINRTGLANNFNSITSPLSGDARQRLLDTFLDHGILRSSATQVEELQKSHFSWLVTESRLAQALEKYNEAFGETEPLTLRSFTDNLEMPVFSRVSDLIWGVRRSISDRIQNILPRSWQWRERSEFNSRLFNVLQAATFFALDSTDQNGRTISRNFYGPRPGCPDVVKNLFGSPVVTPDNPNYGGSLTPENRYLTALRTGGADGLAQEIARVTRRTPEFSQEERNLYDQLGEVFQNSSHDAANLQQFHDLLLQLNTLAEENGVQFAGGYGNLINHLRGIVEEARMPLADRDTGHLLRSTQEALLQFSQFVRAMPRRNWLVWILARGVLPVAAAYFIYRGITTYLIWKDNTGQSLSAWSLLGYESFYLMMSCVIGSGIHRFQRKTSGGAGNAHLRPIFRGLEENPDERSAHAGHCVLVDEPPGATRPNIFSKVVAAFYHCRRSSVIINDNSTTLRSRLGVKAAVAEGKKIWARMELVRRLALASGIDRIGAHYFANAFAGQEDEMLGRDGRLEPRTAYWAVFRLQDCARQKSVSEGTVLEFGRCLADEFLTNQPRGSRFVEQPISWQWLRDTLVRLGVAEEVAQEVATSTFQSLEQVVADARLTQIGRILFNGEISQVDPAARQQISATFIEAAGLHGIRRQQAIDLFALLEKNARNISRIATTVVAETTATDNPETGEFEFVPNGTDLTINPEAVKGFNLMAASLLRVFMNEQEAADIPSALRDKFTIIAADALFNPSTMSLARRLSRTLPIPRKKQIHEAAKNIGARLAEEIGNLPSVSQQIEVMIGATPGLTFEQAFSQAWERRENEIRQVVDRVLDEFSFINGTQRAQIVADVVENMTVNRDQWQAAAREMFQQICRRANVLIPQIILDTTVSQRENDQRLAQAAADLMTDFSGNPAGLYGSRNRKGSVNILLVLRRMALKGRVAKDLPATARVIEGILEQCGDITTAPGRNKLISGLQAKLRFSESQAIRFADDFINEFRGTDEFPGTVTGFREGLRIILSAINNGDIQRISPDRLRADGENVDLEKIVINLPELRTQVEQAVVFRDPAYMGGEKAGTADAAICGDTFPRIIAEYLRWQVEQMIRERTFGLRETPMDLLTQIDDAVSGYQRDLPATMDSYYRDPHFIGHFLIERILAGDSPAQCVEHFFEQAGFNIDAIPDRIRESLEDAASQIQGRIVLGRLVNALGQNQNLDVEAFVEAQFPDAALHTRLAPTRRNELIDRGRRIQDLVNRGLLQFVGLPGSLTLRLSPAAGRKREAAERVFAEHYQAELGNFSFFEAGTNTVHVSPRLAQEIDHNDPKNRSAKLGRLEEINLVYETNEGIDPVSGRPINPIEISEPLFASESPGRFRSSFISAAIGTVEPYKIDRDLIITFAQTVARLAQTPKPEGSYRTTQEIVQEILAAPNFSRLTGFNGDFSVGAANRPALEKAVGQAVTAVKLSLFRNNLIYELTGTLTSSLRSGGTYPDYQAPIQRSFAAFAGHLTADERAQFTSQAERLAGIFDEVRTRAVTGGLDVTCEDEIGVVQVVNGQITTSFGDGDAGRRCTVELSQRATKPDKKAAQKELNDFVDMVIFENPATAEQMTETRITLGQVDDHLLRRVELPGGNGIQGRMAMAEEFRRFAPVVEQLFDLLDGGGAVDLGNGQTFNLRERAIALGGQATARVPLGQINPADLTLLAQNGCLIDPVTGELTVTINLNAQRLAELVGANGLPGLLLSDENATHLRATLRSLFEIARFNTRKIAADLVPEVFAAMGEGRKNRGQALVNSSLYNHNYFEEEAPIASTSRYHAGITKEDADFTTPRIAQVKAAERILEHPMKDSSYRQAGVNARDPGCPQISASGQHIYFENICVANTLDNNNQDAGSPVTISPEAIQHSARFFTKEVYEPFWSPAKTWNRFKDNYLNLPVSDTGQTRADSPGMMLWRNPFIRLGNFIFGAADIAYNFSIKLLRREEESIGLGTNVARAFYDTGIASYNLFAGVTGLEKLEEVDWDTWDRPVDRWVLTADDPKPDELMQINGPYDGTTESEDAASGVIYLRRVARLGDAGGGLFLPWLGWQIPGTRLIRQKYLEWFRPQVLMGAEIVRGIMSIGSVQENILVKNATDFGRWLRGNLALLGQIMATPMGFMRKIEYLILLGYWNTFLVRPLLILTPLLFTYAGYQSVLMGRRPYIFAGAAGLAFVWLMSSFLATMKDSGRRLTSLETWGCVINNWMGLTVGLKNSYHGLFKSEEKPSFVTSMKEFVKYMVRIPMRDLPLEYSLFAANAAATYYGIQFALNGYPWMLAVTVWTGMSTILGGAGIFLMNRGAYIERPDGSGGPMNLLYPRDFLRTFSFTALNPWRDMPTHAMEAPVRVAPGFVSDDGARS